MYLKVMTTEWTQYPQIGCGWTADGRYATSGEIGHDTRSILVFDVRGSSYVKNGHQNFKFGMHSYVCMCIHVFYFALFMFR